VAAAFCVPANNRMDEIVDNIAMHRFEMPIGDDTAVAYYQEQDGRVVLLHTEVPQRFSGQGVGSRLAHAVFETLKARGRRVIAKCPFMSGYATKHPEYLSMLDG
jgi:predicted GNAT family acetyltransferase